MRKRTKTVQGQLLDLDNGNELYKNLVTLTQALPRDGRPENEKATMPLRKHNTELSGKICILKLGEVVSGRVEVNVAATHKPPTNYEIFLQGPEWIESGWFESLKSID